MKEDAIGGTFQGILRDHSTFERTTMDQTPRRADDIMADIDRVAKSLNVLLKEAESAGFMAMVWTDDLNGVQVRVLLEKELGL